MKFSVGDKVILNENGEEAEVIGILNSKIIEVLSYGIEFPVRITDVHFPNLRPPAQTTQRKIPAITSEEKNTPEYKPGFYFSFTPVFTDEKQEEIKLLSVSFLNHTKLPVMLEFQCRFQQRVSETLKSIVSPLAVRQLMEMPMEDMNGKPRFHYKISPVEGNVSWSEGDWFQITDNLLLLPKKLFKHLAEIRLQHQDSFVILLAEWNKQSIASENPGKKLPSKQTDTKEYRGNQTKTVKKSRHKKLNEIDLHAESLGIPIQKLNNFEILTRQLQALEKAIDRAVEHGQTSLVVIHGVGKGKLKEEVHLLLKGHPSVTFFQHTWRPKYGWGATEAFLK